MSSQNNESIEPKKLIIIFIISLISNFLASWFGYAMTHNQIYIQAALGLCIPFFNLFYANALIEAKSFKDRIKLTSAAGLALSIGSTLMLLLQKYL